MKRITFIFTLCYFLGISTSWSRVLILPAVSYSSDLGVIGSLCLFYQDKHPGRITLDASYAAKGSQSYSFQGIRTWKGGEWEWHLSYAQDIWYRYDPYDLEYPNSLVKAFCSGVKLKCAAEFGVGEKVSLGPVFGFNTYRFFDLDLQEPEHPGALQQSNIVTNSWINLDETYVGLRITHDTRDSRYHSVRGTYTRLEYHLMHLSAGENPYVFRATADARWIIPLWDRLQRQVFPRLIWAQMAYAGYIFSDVPDPVLFRMGGSDNLRGFPWRRFDGRGMALYRNEFRLTLVKELPDPMANLREKLPAIPEIRPALEFAIFDDLGTTWYERLNPDRIQMGYGAGFRIVLPQDVVGRLDVAISDDGHYWGIYFALSQSF
jgi:hypothetical protein